MPKLSIEDLNKIRKKSSNSILVGAGGARAKVTVHLGTCGIASGAKNIMDELVLKIEENKVHDVHITTSGCAGLCSREPMITVELAGKPPVKYVNLTKEKLNTIFNNHILGGSIVTKYALAIGCERTY